MSVYVDSVRIKWKGKIWCHLVAASLSELHNFASMIGLKRSWFQNKRSCPHYDICLSKKHKAVELGAIEIDKRMMAKKISQIRRSLREETQAA